MAISKIKIGDTSHDLEAVKLVNARTIDGVSFNGTENVTRYATCSTAAGTKEKTASVTAGTFSLATGAQVTVKFTYANTVTSPTLNINSSGAKAIYWHGATLDPSQYWSAGAVLDFVYNGSQWELIGVAGITEDGIVDALGYLPSETDTKYKMELDTSSGILELAEMNNISTYAGGATGDAYEGGDLAEGFFKIIKSTDENNYVHFYGPAVDLSKGSASYDSSASVYGRLPISNGGTGADTAAGALQNLGLTATAAELNYCDGVTSNIQTQINALLTKIAELEAALANKQDKILTFGDLSGSEVVNVAEEGA